MSNTVYRYGAPFLEKKKVKEEKISVSNGTTTDGVKYYKNPGEYTGDTVIMYGTGFEGVYVYAAPTYPPEGITPEITTGTKVNFYSPPLTEQAMREMIEGLMKKLNEIEEKVDKISKKKSIKKRKVVKK